jgi:spermidine/putrescine transport system permease protein
MSAPMPLESNTILQVGVAGKRILNAELLVRVAVYGVPTALILCPMLVFLMYSFWSLSDGQIVHSFGLQNYIAFVTETTYWDTFTDTLKLTGLVSLSAAVLGYAVAYVVWRQTVAIRYVLLLISVIPLAMNYIVKIYAMRSILGFNGFLNNFLISIGILDAPSKLFLYNETAVLITMIVVYLPYAILPIFLSLERVPESIVFASADLGARPAQTFWRVVFPLSIPGVIAGFVFVMVLALGDFLTPQMVGGNQGFTFSRAIWSQFGMAFNWPLGSALAVILLLAITILLAAAAAVTKKVRQI